MTVSLVWPGIIKTTKVGRKPIHLWHRNDSYEMFQIYVGEAKTIPIYLEINKKRQIGVSHGKANQKILKFDECNICRGGTMATLSYMKLAKAQEVYVGGAKTIPVYLNKRNQVKDVEVKKIQIYIKLYKYHILRERAEVSHSNVKLEKFREVDIGEAKTIPIVTENKRCQIHIRYEKIPKVYMETVRQVKRFRGEEIHSNKSRNKAKATKSKTEARLRRI